MGLCTRGHDIIWDRDAKDFLVTVSQQTLNFCIIYVQRRPNVFDVGPTLYKCHTHVLCLLECLQAWS